MSGVFVSIPAISAAIVFAALVRLVVFAVVIQEVANAVPLVHYALIVIVRSLLLRTQKIYILISNQ